MLSSNIAELDWENKELRVRFCTGPTIYIYGPVSVELYVALLKAPSIGSYFHREVKCNPDIRLLRKE